MRIQQYSLAVVAMLMLVLPASSEAGFAEFSFCPLGGPPGWFNRLTGQHKKRYFYPPPPRYPLFSPAARQGTFPPDPRFPLPMYPARRH